MTLSERELPPIVDAQPILSPLPERAPEAILVVDSSRCVRLANAVAREICGSSAGTVAQLAANLGVGEAALPLFDPAVAERTIELPDGRWIHASAYPTEADAGAGRGEAGTEILVLRDVTHSRAAARAQEAFMGVLSHELRTPVTSIFGYAKMLRRPGLREQSTEMLEDIEAEADRLYRVVEDLLAISQVQAGFRVESEPLLLQRLLPRVIATEAPRWPHVAMSPQLSRDLPTVHGERTYVEQVLRNLVSNAAKYSAPGTKVTITARTTESEVELRVLDRGAGIQRDETDRLFRLFYRSPSTARQSSGAGIGLYVCSGLVRAMGGRIWARPRNGGGSEFGFSLPLAEIETFGDED